MLFCRGAQGNLPMVYERGKVMKKGVILAGGRGTRLLPLTNTTNKHLLKTGQEPMILNPIRQLLSAGIREIRIITNREHLHEMSQTLGTGRALDCTFSYGVQEEPKGIAHALLAAEDFICQDAFAVILGDNILTHSIKPYCQDFQKQGSGAMVLLKKVADPQNYGVAVMDKERIKFIEEKPEIVRSDLAVIGVYFYDPEVFDIIRKISPSARGELEITAVNNEYIKRGRLTYAFLKGHWIDAGTPKAYKSANELLAKTAGIGIIPWDWMDKYEDEDTF